jgi:hypothetical protein
VGYFDPASIEQITDTAVTQTAGRNLTSSMSGLAGERHFTPKELSGLWHLSETKIRRLFEMEPGVLRIGEPSRRVGRKLKRSYYTLRIPESVALRVHRRLTATGRRRD